MKINLLFIAIFSGLGLLGCATTSQYQSQLTAFVGQSPEVLIAKWGTPTARFERQNGDEVIAYIRSRDILVPGTPNYAISSDSSVGLVATPAVSTGTSPATLHQSCMTKFIVRDGVIKSSTFEGNDCKSRNW